jgi:hypothetical protein
MDINQFIVSIVPQKDILKVREELGLPRVSKGGQRAGKKMDRKKRGKKRKTMRGAGEKVRKLMALVIIIGVCMIFQGYCEVVNATTTVAQLNNSTAFDGIFYCHEFHVYQKYVSSVYSIYGRQMGAKTIAFLLEHAKQEIVLLYGTGLGVAGLGAAALTGRRQLRIENTRTTDAKPKFKQLLNKVEGIAQKKEAIPRKPKKSWASFGKIANPKTGRLVDTIKATGRSILQDYVRSSKDPDFANVCNPRTGIWMDVHGDIGKKVINGYLRFVDSKE